MSAVGQFQTLFLLQLMSALPYGWTSRRSQDAFEACLAEVLAPVMLMTMGEAGHD